MNTKLRGLGFASAVCAVLATPLAASAAAIPPGDPAAWVVVNAFVAAVNKGDAAKVAVACAPSTIVIDDFAPYIWTGKGACGKWYAALGKGMAAGAIAAVKATLRAPRYVDIAGARMQIVLPTLVTAKDHGKNVSETGDWTFVLMKMGGSWKIAAQSWAHTRGRL